MPKIKVVLPKKRDRAATESALIAAAMQLFASKGYDATRTLEIAKKAKVNEALITRYFGGKSGLLVAIIKDDGACCPTSAWIKNFDSTKKLKENLKAFFKAGFEHFEERQAFIRIALSQALVDPEMGELLRNKTLDQSFMVMIENLKKYFGKRVKAADLESLAMLLMASNFSINFMGRMVHRIDVKRVDRVLNLLIDSLVGHLDY